MIIYQRMKLSNDIFLNVMHPAMFALQAGGCNCFRLHNFFLALYSNLFILTRLNASAGIRSSSDHSILH